MAGGKDRFKWNCGVEAWFRQFGVWWCGFEADYAYMLMHTHVRMDVLVMFGELCINAGVMIGDLLTASEIEAEAAAAGLSMAEVCRRAGVAQSTFTRWKSGKTEPTLDVYRKLRDAASLSSGGPMGDTVAGSIGGYGVAERQTPLLFPTRHAALPTDAEMAEAAEIFARLDRELLVAEARAERLLRRYYP
jgi:transcriptional regulator with XRE-family HTH domain